MKRILATLILLAGFGTQFSNASASTTVDSKKYIFTGTWTDKYLSFTVSVSGSPNAINFGTEIPIQSYVNMLGLKSGGSSCNNTHPTSNGGRGNSARTIEALDRKKYDIFLSHSYKDKKSIKALLRLFEQNGLRVYVDWLDKNLSDRSKPTRKTVNRLLSQMKSSRLLVFVYTANSSTSTWCSFELGYFTNMDPKSILVFSPGVKQSKQSFAGVEYLTMYPTLVYKDGEKAGNRLFVSLNH